MSWIEHVKQYQKEHGGSYKQALTCAKATYTKKPSVNAKQQPPSGLKGKGLRAIARKMHGAGNGQSGTASKYIGPIMFGGMLVLAMPLILQLLQHRGCLRRRVAPQEMMQIAQEVEEQMEAQQEEIKTAEAV